MWREGQAPPLRLNMNSPLNCNLKIPKKDSGRPLTVIRCFHYPIVLIRNSMIPTERDTPKNSRIIPHNPYIISPKPPMISSM